MVLLLRIILKNKFLTLYRRFNNLMKLLAKEKKILDFRDMLISVSKGDCIIFFRVKNKNKSLIENLYLFFNSNHLFIRRIKVTFVNVFLSFLNLKKSFFIGNCYSVIIPNNVFFIVNFRLIEQVIRLFGLQVFSIKFLNQFISFNFLRKFYNIIKFNNKNLAFIFRYQYFYYYLFFFLKLIFIFLITILMVTIKQAFKLRLVKKFTRSKAKSLDKCPQKKGICLKVTIMKPKKPNSAIRKIAKVRLSNKKKVVGYICGIGHNLQEHASVLVRGGRVRDLPGIHYKFIKGKYDFSWKELFLRKHSRSKYGIPSFYKKLG